MLARVIRNNIYDLPIRIRIFTHLQLYGSVEEMKLPLVVEISWLFIITPSNVVRVSTTFISLALSSEQHSHIQVDILPESNSNLSVSTTLTHTSRYFAGI